MLKNFLFTSESVSEGHPDKIADQISDAILDDILKKDKHAHVACETLIKNKIVVVAGEIKTNAIFSIDHLVHQVILDVGYDIPENYLIINALGKQSNDILQGIESVKSFEQGAGDQGIIFGFATNETKTFMPATIYYAHKLMQRQAFLRKNKHSWLMPDAKSQVTINYRNGKPLNVAKVVISTQHKLYVKQQYIKDYVIEEIILPIFPKKWITAKTKFFINPTGQFVIGGPNADCGLTGRKIIVDTYGGVAHHGGGCFSGKDPSKVDRSASYMGRYIAKNIVASGLADKCEIQISYAIGIANPTSIMINTFGTGKIDDSLIEKIVIKNFDLRPYAIINKLNLLRPIYRKTSNYGHFGRNDIDFSWENTDESAIFSEYLS